MSNPCYDEIARKDCPDRCAGCAITCAKWAEYVQEREKAYAQRKDRHMTDAYVKDHILKTMRRVNKR